MNARALRRLAADHAALHNQDLPPNYLFPAASANSDDLTQLDVLLAGPTHTPFSKGVWRLHLSIPPQYPQQPPSANFRTPIFHPNVDPQTGGVCVETLKRDWDSKLTLRDVLITISCLLIQPNPDSALNADAGALIQENYDSFATRAELMTSIHAVIPKSLVANVHEAQHRGQESQTDGSDEEVMPHTTQAPARRRRTIAKVRAARRSEASPTGALNRHRQQLPQSQSFRSSQPFVLQSDGDDVFGISVPQQSNPSIERIDEDDESMGEGEQENDSLQSPPKLPLPRPVHTPRRPHGIPVALGEMIMEQDEVDEGDSPNDEMEADYPPSPRKSPSKSPPKRKQAQLFRANSTPERPESSRDASQRAPNITPPNFSDKPLAEDSPFAMDVTFDESLSPRKTGLRARLFGNSQIQAKKPFVAKTPDLSSAPTYSGDPAAGKRKSPHHAAERQQTLDQQLAEADSKLWVLCGQDIRRWNRGDFDGQPLRKKAVRW